MTHGEILKKHMEEKGSITVMEAFDEYGITNIRDPIYHMRKNGISIVSKKIPFESRQGFKSNYTKYSLVQQ